MRVISVAELPPDWQIPTTDWLCPLTLDLPARLNFPGQEIFRSCKDIAILRRKLSQQGYLTGNGSHWLPVVLTSKGPIYAEVIGLKATGPLPLEIDREEQFVQPIYFADHHRQPIYQMGQHLLSMLAAPPSVYLLKFGWEDETPYFDRLIPFPAKPAIASVNNQIPDLFTCHWYCLTGLPITDLAIGS